MTGFYILHNSFLNQTTFDLRKEKWTFLNREFTVFIQIFEKCKKVNITTKTTLKTECLRLSSEIKCL